MFRNRIQFNLCRGLPAIVAFAFLMSTAKAAPPAQCNYRAHG